MRCVFLNIFKCFREIHEFSDGQQVGASSVFGIGTDVDHDSSSLTPEMIAIESWQYLPAEVWHVAMLLYDVDAGLNSCCRFRLWDKQLRLQR